MKEMDRDAVEFDLCPQLQDTVVLKTSVGSLERFLFSHVGF